jgi:hypothetical protein
VKPTSKPAVDVDAALAQMRRARQHREGMSDDGYPRNDVPSTEGMIPPTAEDSVALRFAERHADELRFAEAEAAFEAARAHVVEARSQAADVLVEGSSATVTIGEACITIGQARSAVVATEDAVEIAKTALDRAGASVREAELEERLAAVAVVGEVNAICAGVVGRLLPVAENALRTLSRCAVVLR